jgi:hypothetical protein
MTRQNKQITEEEGQYLLMRHLVGLIDYWDRESRAPTARDKLEGLMHSTLATLDGSAGGLPGYAIVPMESPEDLEFANEKGYDYYPVFHPNDLPGEVYDVGGSLHERMYQYVRGEVKRPENLYDFGSMLADDARRMHAMYPNLSEQLQERAKAEGIKPYEPEITLRQQVLGALEAAKEEFLKSNPYDRRDSRFPSKAESLVDKAIERIKSDTNSKETV